MVTKAKEKKPVNWAVRDRLKADRAAKLGATYKAKKRLEEYDKTHSETEKPRRRKTATLVKCCGNSFQHVFR